MLINNFINFIAICYKNVSREKILYLGINVSRETLYLVFLKKKRIVSRETNCG
jgi:hypothetical protein